MPQSIFNFLTCWTHELRAALLKQKHRTNCVKMLNCIPGVKYPTTHNHLDSLISLPQPQAEAIVVMIEIDEYVQRFHIALFSSAFNESDRSSNYVVIVTTISHWAICVSLSGLCQPTLIQINSTLCSAVIACFFSLPDTPFLLMDFQTLLGCWMCAVFCMLIQHQLQSCVFVCVNMSHANF